MYIKKQLSSISYLYNAINYNFQICMVQDRINKFKYSFVCTCNSLLLIGINQKQITEGNFVTVINEYNLFDFVNISITLQNIFFSLLRIVFVLVGVAYFTLAERKIMAAIQRRKGPNVVGIFGLLQPLADGLKLLCKEMIIPTKASSVVFIVAPIFILMMSLVSWVVIPFSSSPAVHMDIQTPNWFILNYIAGTIVNELSISDIAPRNFYYPISDINLSILFVLAISSLNVYGIIIGGWASNSKYAFLGALRSAAQMISYEVSIGLTIIPVILLAGSLNFTELVLAQERTVWFAIPLLPCAAIFFISMLAETNRAPFDLPEAEAELVAGYNVEYSSIIFAMFFLGEYSNMLLMSAIITILFFGGWLPFFEILSFIPGPFWFGLKVAIFCFLFVLVRATFPRYRYDQLMNIGWKVFLPITLAYFFFTASILYVFGSMPFSAELVSIYSA